MESRPCNGRAAQCHGLLLYFRWTATLTSVVERVARVYGAQAVDVGRNIKQAKEPLAAELERWNGIFALADRVADRLLVLAGDFTHLSDGQCGRVDRGQKADKGKLGHCHDHYTSNSDRSTAAGRI